MLTSGAPPLQMLIDQICPEGKEKLFESVHSLIKERYGTGPFTVTNVATLGCAEA